MNRKYAIEKSVAADGTGKHSRHVSRRVKKNPDLLKAGIREEEVPMKCFSVHKGIRSRGELWQ